MSAWTYVVCLLLIFTIGHYLRRKEKEADALVAFVEKTHGQRLVGTKFTNEGVILEFQNANNGAENVSFLHRGGRNPSWCQEAK